MKMKAGYMSIKLLTPQIQDLSDIFFEYIYEKPSSSHDEIDRLANRFDIPLEDTRPTHGTAAPNRFRAMMKNINGTDKLIALTSYMLKSEVSPQDIETIEKLNRIFVPHSYTVVLSGETIVLQPTTGTLTQKLVEEQRSWIEENAPMGAVTQLQDARKKLGRGEWKESLAACRNALEALTTTGSFTSSLEELSRNDVIAKGSMNRKKDEELLKAIYGFCSTTGTHTEGQTLANEERARMGLLVTDAAVYFLVKQIKDARRGNLSLREWH
jgi:hypothetical protein